MTDLASRTPRVAVYIDFDNVVISRYDQIHGGRRDAWRADDVRRHAGDADSVVGQKLLQAHIDVGALLDYAASYGRVAIARAYADWSVPVNASYQRQLVDRAVDLTQLFPVSGTKNGADIRLAVDAIDDLMRYDDITHVVLVAGDSDYIALAQRCKQLGRYVVGIGVSGSTSRALVAACDEYTSYDDVPGVEPVPQVATTLEPATAAAVVTTDVAAPPADAVEPGEKPRRVPARKRATAAAKKAAADGAKASPPDDASAAAPTAPAKKAARKAVRKASAPATTNEAPTSTTRQDAADAASQEPGAPGGPRQREATALLVRALRLARDPADTSGEWQNGGGVKSQMQRMDPGFKEKSLGYRTFTAFVESRADVVESRTDGADGHLLLRLRG